MHNDKAISTTPVQVEEIVFAHENVLKCLSKVLCIFDYISSLSLIPLSRLLVLEMGFMFNSYNFLLHSRTPHWVDFADTEHHAKWKLCSFPFFFGEDTQHNLTSAWFASDSYFIIKRQADIHIRYAWENIVEDAINF